MKILIIFTLLIISSCGKDNRVVFKTNQDSISICLKWANCVNGQVEQVIADYYNQLVCRIDIGESKHITVYSASTAVMCNPDVMLKD